MTQLPFNPRTMTAKKALAALSEHPDLTVAELADLLAEEGRHTNSRSSVRKELNARIEAAAALDDEPEEDVADEPDEEDESPEAATEAEAGDEVLEVLGVPVVERSGLVDPGLVPVLESGEDVTVTLPDGTVHEGRFKRYVTGIEAVLRDQRDTVVVLLDGDWVVTPKPPEPEEDDEDE